MQITIHKSENGRLLALHSLQNSVATNKAGSIDATKGIACLRDRKQDFLREKRIQSVPRISSFVRKRFPIAAAVLHTVRPVRARVSRSHTIYL